MELVWPLNKSMEEVLSALRNTDRIGQLTCDFNDEQWDTSQQLREALIFVKNSSSSHTVFINTIRALNSCDDDEEKKKHCLDFFS